MKSRQIFGAAALVALGCVLFLLAAPGVSRSQSRVAVTPKPQGAPQPALQPAQNIPVPPTEIGLLKQQVAQLQVETTRLTKDVIALNAELAKLKQNFEKHGHEMGLGWVNWKTMLMGGCPDCMVPYQVPGKTPNYTSKALY
jgi:hypothetical protein